MSRSLGHRVVAALGAGTLAALLASCTSAAGEPGETPTSVPGVEVEPAAEVDPTVDAEPDGDETSAVPTYATEPDEVEVPSPVAVEPGAPVETDGRLVLPAVALDQAVVPADAADTRSSTGEGLTIWLDDFTSVDAVDPRPGAIGGPGIQFGVLIRNDGAEAFDLATVVVGVEYGAERIPAEDVLTADSRPLTGTVEPGQTLRGVFDFVVPEADRDQVVVVVDLVNELPVTLFAGAVGGR